MNVKTAMTCVEGSERAGRPVLTVFSLQLTTAGFSEPSVYFFPEDYLVEVYERKKGLLRSLSILV